MLTQIIQLSFKFQTSSLNTDFLNIILFCTLRKKFIKILLKAFEFLDFDERTNRFAKQIFEEPLKTSKTK